MDPVLALALLSLGAFVCVIATGLVYLWAVRPRLIEMEQNQTEPVGLSLKPQKAPPPRPPAPPTRLADIKGIGPVYEKVLQAAGVDTFEKLAALTPEQLGSLISAPDWRPIDAQSWLEQARLYAGWLKDAEDEA